MTLSVRIYEHFIEIESFIACLDQQQQQQKTNRQRNRCIMPKIPQQFLRITE